MKFYQLLERYSFPTILGAKRDADIYDVGVWRLPSNGKYIALPLGIEVPAGAKLVSKRLNNKHRWENLNDLP